MLVAILIAAVIIAAPAVAYVLYASIRSFLSLTACDSLSECTFCKSAYAATLPSNSLLYVLYLNNSDSQSESLPCSDLFSGKIFL